MAATATIYLTTKYYHWSSVRARQQAEEARRRAEAASETERRARNLHLKSTLVAGTVIMAFTCYGIYRLSQIVSLAFGLDSAESTERTRVLGQRVSSNKEIKYV